jgi:hypothetical protein
MTAARLPAGLRNPEKDGFGGRKKGVVRRGGMKAEEGRGKSLKLFRREGGKHRKAEKKQRLILAFYGPEVK